MQAPSYLIKIGCSFYAQVRVPQDIVASYGRKQHRKSLRTNDRNTAVDRLPAALVAIKAEFAKHLATLQAVATATARPAPTLRRTDTCLF